LTLKGAMCVWWWEWL